MVGISKISGGVTAAKGFIANGIKAGMKRSGHQDLGVIISEVPWSEAGSFTTNAVRAACVGWNEKILPSSTIKAICCNAGNANACTGKQGVADVKSTAKTVADLVGSSMNNILVASTGVIGEFMPMDKMYAAIPVATKGASVKGGVEFSRAIMTTDTVKKEFAVKVKLSTGEAIIGGTSKGSGMIHPNMATMLGFITTDAKIDSKILNGMVKRIVDRTFNNLTIDGDTSTNDMVLVLANGLSGAEVVSAADKALFEEALFTVANELCAKIAEDGEGATKRIEINAKGGKNFANCKLAAKSVANSNLVKCAMFGNDPNWGRILCAVGYSGAKFSDKNMQVKLCGTTVFENGSPKKFDHVKVSNAMKKKVVAIDIDLGFGDESHAVAHTCDFSYDYVKINAEYHT